MKGLRLRHLGLVGVLAFVTACGVARAAPAAPDAGVDPQRLGRRCGSSTCHTAQELWTCLDASNKDVTAADQLWIAGEMRRCAHDPDGNKPEIVRALLLVAIQARDSVSVAVAAALVDTGELTPAQAKLLPTRGATRAAVTKLLGKHKDGYEKIDGDTCVLLGTRKDGALDVDCAIYDGCVRACEDRVLAAEVSVDASGWKIVELRERTADTGGCGDCLDGY